MSVELKLLLRPLGRFLLLLLAFWVVIVGGVLLNHSSQNLFATYARAFPIISVIFSFVYALTLRPWLNLTLSCGGSRRMFSRAVQVCILLLIVWCVGLAALCSVLTQNVLEPWAVTHFTLPFTLFLLLLSLMSAQFGLVLGCIDFSSRKVWAGLTVMVSVVTVTLAVGIYLSLLAHTFSFSFSSPFFLTCFALLLVLSAVFGAIATYQYRKAVVQI